MSIIVPTYNVENFIGRCATSIFSQNYDDMEIIFINDCSSDNSENIIFATLEKYPYRKDQVRVVKTEKNSGIAAVRNLGIQLAKGEYIYQVDGDDYLEPFVLHKYMEIVKSNKVDALIFDYYIDYCNYKEKISYKFDDKNILLCNILSADTPPCIWNKIIKKDVILKNDLNFINGINFGEDYYWMVGVLRACDSITYCDVVGYNYVRYNTKSYTSTIKDEYIYGLILILNKLKVELPQLNKFITLASKEKIVKNIKFLNSINVLSEVDKFLNQPSYRNLKIIDFFFLFLLKVFGVKITLVFCNFFNFTYKMYKRIKN